MDDYKGLSIIIPAYNEESSIAQVLNELVACFTQAEIIVVDDGSTDKTLQIIKGAIKQSPQIQLLQHRYNRGYGSALKTGMLKSSNEYIAWFDSDGEMNVEDLKAMYQKILSTNTAAVIGKRNRQSPSTITRRVGKTFIRGLAYALNIKGSYDLNCGLRIFRSEVIKKYLSILPNQFSASMTSTILLLERGYPIEFYPVKMGRRIGTSTVRIKDGFQAAVKVLQLITLFAPIRLYFVPGLFILIMGVIYGSWVTFSEGTGFPTAGILATLTGFMCCVLGLIADHVSHLRLDGMDLNAVIIEKINSK
ncbi:glycosyltransferase family 2 protein [Maricurvus nonylphenolicus]|uniref:glycosyltransferase family 2 protein n=1 Tax=Maricurvus nonylphenolicus TaxID=1008307 RepID=UPI0036F36D93